MSNRETIFGGIGAAIGAGLVFLASLVGGSSPADKAGPPQSAFDFTCPSGWTLQVVQVEDAIAPRCEKGDYTVWIDGDSHFSHGARFNRATDTIIGDFITDPAGVPEWLQ